MIGTPLLSSWNTSSTCGVPKCFLSPVANFSNPVMLNSRKTLPMDSSIGALLCESYLSVTVKSWSWVNLIFFFFSNSDFLENNETRLLHFFRVFPSPSVSASVSASASVFATSASSPSAASPSFSAVAEVFSNSSKRRPIGKYVDSIIPTERSALPTRNALLMLAARNAAPSAMASSPLRWTPKSPTAFSWKKSARSSCTLGTRTPPPIISTWLIWSIVRFAISNARSTGPRTRSIKSSVIFSNCSRVTDVPRKSMSSHSDSIVMGYCLLALSTFLTFSALLRSFAMERWLVRTSFFPLRCFIPLKASAMNSTSFKSKAKPPKFSSQLLPMVSNWPNVWFFPLFLAVYVVNSNTLTCVELAPML